MSSASALLAVSGAGAVAVLVAFTAFVQNLVRRSSIDYFISTNALLVGTSFIRLVSLAVAMAISVVIGVASHIGNNWKIYLTFGLIGIVFALATNTESPWSFQYV